MGLFFTIVYLLYMYGSPASWVPVLATAQVQVYLSVLAFLATLPKLLNGSLFSKTPQVPMFFGFFFVLVCTPILHGWLGGIPQAVREQAPYAIVLFLVRVNCTTIGRRKALVLLLALLMTLLAVAGAINFSPDAADPENKFIFRQNTDETPDGEIVWVNRLKAQGLFDDPNDFAQGLLVAVMLYTVILNRGTVANMMRMAVPYASMAYGVYLTHSRGAVVATAITIGVALRKKLKIWGAIAFAMLLMLGMVAARFNAGRSISVNSGADRLELWSEGLAMLKHSLGIGIGYRMYVDEVGLTAHNSILLVATELGIIGLLFFVAALVISFQQISRLRVLLEKVGGQTETLRELRAYELALTVYLASSWFLSRAYHPTPYLLVGLIASVTAEQCALHPDWSPTPRAPEWIRNTILVSFGALALIYLMVKLRAA